MKEIVRSRQPIYDGRVVKLSVLEVELPNGAIAKREVIAHPGAVAIVALDADQQVLLVRQFRMAVDSVMLEIPAGTLNPGEEVAFCAARELQEETGFRPGVLEKLGGIHVAPGYTSEYIHLFLATQLVESRLPMDDDEFIELERAPLAEALRLIDEGVIHDAKSVSGLLLADRVLRTRSAD